MEIILSFKVYHPSYGSFFTSASTYLLKKTSGFTSSNTIFEKMRVSNLGHITHLSSYRQPVVSQSLMGVMPLLWKHGGLHLSEGRQFQTLWPTCSQQNDGFFPKHGWQFRVNVVFQTVLTRNEVYKISFGIICG